MTHTNHTLNDINRVLSEYAVAERRLSTLAAGARAAVARVTHQYEDEMRAAMTTMNNCRADARAMVESNPALFAKPKTRVLHGVKIGLRKRRGRLVINNPAKTIAQIEREYHDPAGYLIQVKKVLLKTGLEKLSAKELKRLGVEVQQDTDQAVFYPVADDVDGIVEFLLVSNQA